ncbi:MAG: Uma2 family endonuclease [Lachnospiraceae bacterium]|nr:Uma2 family endonuclease [Lachnospiraceae bacterium]
MKKQETQENQELRRETEKKGFTYEQPEDAAGKDMVCEAAAQYAYKRQGEYTLEDYYALPDERRVELIDGIFYDMASPYTTHQIASAEIWRQLAEFIRGKGGSCRALFAPVDVQLDCDDKTMVQPDILVLCDREKLIKRCIYGAPDFVIEILSDSTARKDMTVKLWKYLGAGVREYWIVDLQQEKVIVHDKTGGDCRTSIYGMDQPVPVQIFEGKCQIRFEEICEEVRAIRAK